MNQQTSRTTRRLLIVAAAVALTALGASTAHADPGPAAPTAPTSSDIAAANAAAAGSLGTVAKFFAAGGQQPGGSAQAQALAAQAAAPKLDSATVPVYYLDRAFVAGVPSNTPNTPVAGLVFMATDTVSSSGAHASVWTAKTPTGWQVVNIATGSDETAYAAQAGPGGIAFEEPQIDAWYTLRGGRVLPLNAPATTSVGAGGMPVAQYQALVKARYGDKLPGSAYDKNGMAGGFDPSTKADTVQQARPVVHAVPAPNGSSGTAKPASADGALLATSGAMVIALAAGGIGFAAYRRVSANR
jgi:hypothetical protein